MKLPVLTTGDYIYEVVWVTSSWKSRRDKSKESMYAKTTTVEVL